MAGVCAATESVVRMIDDVVSQTAEQLAAAEAYLNREEAWAVYHYGVFLVAYSRQADARASAEYDDVVEPVWIVRRDIVLPTVPDDDDVD